MKVSHALLDERIDNNTTVVIQDKFGGALAFGRWYQDKILMWGNFEASFEFEEERNRLYLQLLP